MPRILIHTNIHMHIVHAHNERDTERHTENVLVWLCVSYSAVSICAWTTFSLVFSMVRLYFHVRTLTEHSSVPRRTDVKTKFSLDTQLREKKKWRKKRFAQRRAISVIDFFRFSFRCVEFDRIFFFHRRFCEINKWRKKFQLNRMWVGLQCWREYELCVEC